MAIVSSSIPLAILVGIVGLFLTGNTLNLMTLGGLALAIGMLVDDATVAVEYIHRNRASGKRLTVAILDGAHEVATPALAATLTICIVFFPVVLLTGPARYLFTPLAVAVVFSMLASYVLSRTLVPALARLLESEHAHAEARGQRSVRPLQPLARRRASAASRTRYGRMLERGAPPPAAGCSPRFAVVVLHLGGAAGRRGRARLLPRRGRGPDAAPLPRARSEHASPTPSAWCSRPSGRSARSSPPRSWRRSTTTSASRSPTTWPSSPPTTSAPRTPRSSSRSSPATSPRAGT